jgi:putative hemolysin
MKTMLKIAFVTAALALACGSAALAAGKPEGAAPYGKGAANGKGPTYTPSEPTPGPKAGMPAKAKAYGRNCQGKSKKHVKGEKGTEFSRCVNNMAQAATHKNMAPGQVCKGESKKHVKGEKGTEFSRCVKDVNDRRKEEHEKEHEEESAAA